MCEPSELQPGSLVACPDLKFESVANPGMHCATVHAACACQHDHDANYYMYLERLALPLLHLDLA